MGNLGGHALPGTFFVILGVWHLSQLCSNYFRCKRRGGSAFKASTYFPLPCCSKYPLEPILKIVFAIVGTTGEIATAFRGGTFVNIGNGQHICMYTAFGICALLEVLQFYRFNFPYGVIYLSYVLSFLAEMVLFYWHLHVTQPLEAQVHTMLLYIIFGTICSLLAEMTHRSSIVPALLRAYLLVLQGVWFWQVAFILYPPPRWTRWDWQSHQHMMIVAIIFCAEIFATFVVAMIVWFSTACRYGLLRRPVTETSYVSSTVPGSDRDFAVMEGEEREEQKALIRDY